MTERVSYQSPETPVIYAATLRFHHFNIYNVRDALLGIGDPHQAAIDMGEQHLVLDEIYDIDVRGENSEDKYRYMMNYESYLKKLRDLHDNSFVKLTIQPDGICDACAFGAHCTAENYRIFGRISSTYKGELEQHSNLLEKLRSNKSKEGVDFFSITEPYLLFDLQGEDLTTSIIPIEIVGTAPALVVKTKTLRQIAKKDIEYERKAMKKVTKELMKSLRMP